jgi:hypothetical protein
MNSASLFPALLSAKRGELEFRGALGVAIRPEAFQPEVATAIKTAWLGTGNAVATICRAIKKSERPAAPVIYLATTERRRRKGN